MEKITLSLLDNSIDYIHEAVKPISEKSDKSTHSWKYPVLHLYSGIELLLKEKLRQEHWSLIFQDINSARFSTLKNGGFVSVYHDELTKKLKNISQVKINDEPIKKLRDLRNRFEHFEVDISLSECQNIVAAALDEIIAFWETYLKSVSTVEQQKKFKIIKSIATKFDVYIKQRSEKFEQAMRGIVESKNGVIVSCPDCSSLYFAIFKDNEEECRCFVCDEKYKKYDYLKKIRDNEKEGDLIGYEPYDTICPCCKKETRIRYNISDEAPSYCCLNCLYQEEEIKISSELEEFLENFKNAKTLEETIEIAKGFPIEEIRRINQLLEDTKLLLITKLQKNQNKPIS